MLKQQLGRRDHAAKLGRQSTEFGVKLGALQPLAGVFFGHVFHFGPKCFQCLRKTQRLGMDQAHRFGQGLWQNPMGKTQCPVFALGAGVNEVQGESGNLIERHFQLARHRGDVFGQYQLQGAADVLQNFR